jgi:hypothetical protein
MTYEWEFETAGRSATPPVRRCFRGPMIPIEVVMSRAFTRITQCEKLRNRTLDHIVSSTLRSVQTREVVLRTLHSNLAGIYVDLVNQQKELEVLICEKRNSIPIDSELLQYDLMYEEAANSFKLFGINKDYGDKFIAALKSSNAVLRVAARCAIVLMAANIEMRSL